MFLTCIQEVPGPNLGQGTEYPDWGVLYFFSVPPEEFPDNILNYDMTASFHTFYNSVSTIMPSFDTLQSELIRASLKWSQKKWLYVCVILLPEHS
jgi:hypothetical protein